MSVSTLDELFAPNIDSIESGELASHAKRRMDTNETRSLLVVDNGQLVGLVQRNALLHLTDDDMEKPVSAFMTTEIPRLKQSQSIEEATQSMGSDINVEQIPVLDESGKLVGVVNRPDLVAASAHASTPYGGDDPPPDRMPVENGMTVKDANGSKLGEVAEVDFQADGGVEFVTIEHGLIFKKQKRFPGEVVNRVEDGELLLAITSQEFGMIKDIGEE